MTTIYNYKKTECKIIIKKVTVKGKVWFKSDVKIEKLNLDLKGVFLYSNRQVAIEEAERTCRAKITCK